ncbi:hypothetical protein TGMAS_366270 [Toxoplasma gondii MAS]|uniref:Uncharacterized protein n=1 Tax=Toxoplasma gondii MAS TaxID=943118 RepID=A0A086QTE6_TOXGO|nr:hypothetical protein TGMAS_366270 [Toxoplasma gondii MAS]
MVYNKSVVQPLNKRRIGLAARSRVLKRLERCRIALLTTPNSFTSTYAGVAESSMFSFHGKEAQMKREYFTFRGGDQQVRFGILHFRAQKVATRRRGSGWKFQEGMKKEFRLLSEKLCGGSSSLATVLQNKRTLASTFWQDLPLCLGPTNIWWYTLKRSLNLRSNTSRCRGGERTHTRL